MRKSGQQQRRMKCVSNNHNNTDSEKNLRITDGKIKVMGENKNEEGE